MTPKERYEDRRAKVRDERMAEEEAYAARMRKEAAADESAVVMLEGLKAFFSGQATLHIEPMKPGIGQSVRFVRDA